MKKEIYEFIYLDKKGNVLKKEYRECYSKKDAIITSRAFLEVILDNDVHKIKTKKKPIKKN